MFFLKKLNIKVFFFKSNTSLMLEIIIDGEGIMKDTRRAYFAKWGTYFLREIQHDCDQFI